MIAVFDQEPSSIIRERKCNRCSNVFPIENFGYYKRSKDRKTVLYSFCNKCRKEKANEFRRSNKERINKEARERHNALPEEKKKEKWVKARKNPNYKKYAKDYREKNKKKIAAGIEACRKRLQLNPEYRKRQADKMRTRRATDKNLKIKHYCRVRIRAVLIGAKKYGGLEELTGCENKILIKYIDGSEGYGEGKHIDHYIPCSYFDLTKEDSQKICFNWRNLRVVDAFHNLSKNAKLPDDHKEVESEIRGCLSLDSASL